MPENWQDMGLELDDGLENNSQTHVKRIVFGRVPHITLHSNSPVTTPSYALGYLEKERDLFLSNLAFYLSEKKHHTCKVGPSGFHSNPRYYIQK